MGMIGVIKKTLFLPLLFLMVNSDSPPKMENHLATKTPYRFIAQQIQNQSVNFEGCVPKKIWMLARHGTRNPSADSLIDFKTRLSEIKDVIVDKIQNKEIFNSETVQLFKNWKIDLKVSQEKLLVAEGEQEMIHIARRLQNRFPTILDSEYNKENFYFKHTNKIRTKQSAESFCIGLFGGRGLKNVEFPKPLGKDPILRFYKLCERWEREVKKNPKAMLEVNKFKNGTEMSQITAKLNEQLGLENYLTNHDVHLIYTMCCFEIAWNKSSPWCSLLKKPDFRVLEYLEDLKYYWIDGYGYELTYKQACPAFKDMINFMQNKDTKPKATLYFSHSGALLKLLAHLGLYKDEYPLLANGYDKNRSRKWRTSRIDAFATNIVFVLYDCKGEPFLLTLHQENIVNLPSCPHQQLCKLSNVIDYYKSSVYNCDFKKMCSYRIKTEL